MNNEIIVSIIIPIYNEEKNIRPLIRAIEEKLRDIPHEIICIDDHSKDASFSLLKKLKRYHVHVYQKQGKKGKAYSLIEGFQKARGQLCIMIDADLQYPPDVLPEMIEKLSSADVVVANRTHTEVSRLRRTMSNVFRTFFGKGLFGMPEDIQSGLKAFKKSVWNTIAFTPKSPWTFDLEFLHRAKQAGFAINSININFAKRHEGTSHISWLRSSIEVAVQALLLKGKTIKPVYIKGKDGVIGYKKQQFVPHTTLHHDLMAIRTFTKPQIIGLLMGLSALLISFILAPLFTLQVVVGILSSIYFVDACFHLYLMMRSVRKNITVTLPQDDLEMLDESVLPMYSILCPLYKEAHVLDGFLEAIEKIDYPKEKLDVLLLLEEDDKETIDVVKHMSLPSYVTPLIVPDSAPKTKPKACNYGLKYAKGEMLVIYDAEDIPDPLQLKKAFLAFSRLPREVICLQAQLNYYNPEQNLLTRFFTAEYSLWFDVILPGLQSFNTTIPLGGTSNHFRTEDLRSLYGWDPFNVTEDADLGVRLFRKGYKTAVITSTTFEEANSNLKNWIRQRSRWLKGYMQTYLVHLRRTKRTEKQSFIHTLMFHLTVGGKLAFILINPFLWVVTFLYYAAYHTLGEKIEAVYVPVVFYMAIISLIFGNFMYLYFYMIGLAKRNQWSLIKYVYLIPLYWLMISYAGAIACYQLLFKPYYWEKTIHGLNKKKSDVVTESKEVMPITRPRKEFAIPSISLPKLPHIPSPVPVVTKVLAVLLVFTTMLASVIHLGFTVYLANVLDMPNLSIFGTLQSMTSLILVPLAALTAAVNYRTGFLKERYSTSSAFLFWRTIRNKSILFASGAFFIWLAAVPSITNYFHFSSSVPLYILAPIIPIGVFQAINKGYLSGISLLGGIVFLIIFEPIAKVYIGLSLIKYHSFSAVYTSIPVSILLTSFFAWFLIKNRQLSDGNGIRIREVRTFPKKFFIVSLLSGLATVLYLNVDTILVRHFFSEFDSGRYILLATVGKFLFFLGTVMTQIMIPFIEKDTSEKESEKTLWKLLAGTFGISGLGFITFGLFSKVTLPLLFGTKAYIIMPFIPLYTIGIFSYSLATVFIMYYLAKKVYTFVLSALGFTLIEVILISLHHETLMNVTWFVMMTGVLELLFLVVLHFHITVITQMEKVLYSQLYLGRTRTIFEANKPRVLIFNWRDLHHSWAGGAEVYIHELAKRFVKDGYAVTFFTAKDKRSPSSQISDGIEIIRRGGFYTVYFWAAIYYFISLRSKADIVIDSENGIPFFTPLYVRKPVYLLIHHVHQHVFRKHLRFPLSSLAKFLEGSCMPLLYQSCPIITVSESSKKEILDLGFKKEEQVHIVNPGIDKNAFFLDKKTSYPSFIYLGRLKPYKKIDLALEAFVQVKQQYKHAKFFIVGEGEAITSLMQLTKKLQLNGSVEFFGKVTEEEKASLLAKSWVMVQPSEIEGFGITVVEANASGTPVIASKVNGLKDSVVDQTTGLLVEPDNIEKLCDAMIHLIKYPNFRKKLSENAYIWSRNYHWEESARSFLRIIKTTAPEGTFLRETQLSPVVVKEAA